MHIRSVHHLAIVTSQYERLREFYAETLGLPVVGGFPGHAIVFLDAGGVRIELIREEAPAEMPPSALAVRRGWHHLAWEVDDVDAAHADLVARGVESSSSPEDFPSESPGLRIAFLRDPDGNLIEVVQPVSRQPLRSQAPAVGAAIPARPVTPDS